MTPEERLVRLRDLDRWGARLAARTDAHAARRRISPMIVSFATVAAVAVIVAVVFSALGLGIRSVRQPAVPAPTGTPTPTRAEAPTVDDGRVMPLAFTDEATDSSVEQQNFRGGGVSQPWVLYSVADPNSTLISIAWISGSGGDCGEHLGVSVMETAKTVTIASLDSFPSGTTCAGAHARGTGMVQLNRPLGARILYHAALSNSSDSNLLHTVAPVAQPDHIGSATCSNLLDVATLARLKSQGLENASAQFSAKMAAAPHQDLHRFLAYGGMICGWSGGNEYGVGYGYGPITAALAKSEMKRLDSGNGLYKHVDRSVKNGITYYTYSDGSKVRVAFGHGYWASAFDNGGGDILDELIRNAPKF